MAAIFHMAKKLILWRLLGQIYKWSGKSMLCINLKTTGMPHNDFSSRAPTGCTCILSHLRTASLALLVTGYCQEGRDAGWSYNNDWSPKLFSIDDQDPFPSFPWFGFRSNNFRWSVLIKTKIWNVKLLRLGKSYKRAVKRYRCFSKMLKLDNSDIHI